MSVYLRRFLYVVFGLIALVLLLVVGVVVYLQFPAGQDFVARRAEGYLRDKLKTEVRLGTFRTDFRHAINFDNVYLADQQRDTLLSVGHLGVSVDIFALLKKQVNIKDVELENGRVRLTRTEPDSVNNYDFIIKAFTDPTAPVDTTSSGLKYDIGRVHLANILFTQNDQVAGSDLRAKLGDLLVNMDEVDVDNAVYKVDNVALRHAAIRMEQIKTAPELDNKKPEAPLALTFGLNKATLEDVAFTYKNAPAAQYIDSKIGLADVTAKNIDLKNERIDLDKLTLKNTTFAYAQNQNVPVSQRVINPAEAVRKVDEAAQKATAAPLKWRVTLAQSDISQVAVNFDNFNDPKLKTRYPALDYSHLHFTDLVLNTRDLTFTENRTTLKLDNLAGKDQSGFAISSARANVVYDSVQIALDSLDLITPNSRIKRSLGLRYKSLSAIADDLPNLGLSGDLRNTRLGFRDILYLVPSLASTPPFTTGPNQSILLSGLVTGRLGDLLVRNLDFVGLRNTVVQARRAHIVGLPNVDGRLYVDLDIQKFTTTRADLLSVLPKGTVPGNISIPPSLSLSGTFKGRPTTLAFDTNLKLRSTYGNVAFSGKLGAKQANGQQPLVGTFAVQNFDAGKLLKDPTIGPITGTGRINATGNLQDPNTLVGKLTANVQSARYNGYTYHGVATSVDIDRGKYTIAASSHDDPNLDLDLKAVVNLRDAKNPSYEVTSLNLRGANLTALGFYTGGNLKVQGDLQANLRGSSLNTINGTFSGDHIVITKDKQRIPLDSVQGRIVQTATRTAVDFNSNVAAIKLDGNVHLGDLATELQRHINRYFHLAGVAPFRNEQGNQQFTYSLRVKNTRLVRQFVPGLRRLSPFVLAGDYSRAAARLTAKTDIRFIRYQNYRLDSLTLDVNSDPSKLDYALRLARARQDTSLTLRRPSIVGNVADNKINTRASILGDSSNRERLALAGALEVLTQGRGSAYQFAFANDQIINYDTWTAGAGNYVRYNADGTIVANNLRLTNGTSALVVQSQNPAVNTSPLAVRFEQFNLGIVSKAIGQADSTLGGTLNGEAVARNLGTARQAFTANLTIKDLLYNKIVLGDLALQASNPVADRYDVNARLTGGGGNDVTLRGAYRTAGANPLDFVLDVARLNVKTAEPFSAGQITQATGFLSGQLTIAGTTSAPQVRGQLTTSPDASFVVPQLGSPFRLVSQPVTFDDRGIAFNNFTVLDSAGNKAVANGYLLTKNLVDYAFDLRVTTNKFLAVKSRRTKDNTLYYGRLVVDSETRLTGPLSLIKIDTRATVVDGSDLTVENPAADPSVVAREGIVQFVDLKPRPKPHLVVLSEPDSTNTSAIGYDITATITINDNTPFTFIVDPVSGDNLRVRAAGTLTTTLDPSGNLTLTGRLDVRRGKYKLSLYGLVTREFIIARGSSIVWNGDPYNADLNITAIYKIKTAPAELLAGQGSDSQYANTLARNALPFNVAIKVTDQLSKPTIGFDITLPEDQRGALGGEVEAKLAQLRQPTNTSEQSKQVFSLLVLGRFIQQNPFETTAGEGIIASQLRGSVSQVLTDQLQSLTGKYLAGLGLDLGITNQADYSTGSAQSRTDLNVAVRRQLLNNRLTVRLGTDVPLSGNTGTQATQGSSAASNFAGDVSLEYTLLKDGRLRLRAFRQNAYEDIDGNIVRTGASLVFQRDYNNFKDLFAKLAPEVKRELRDSRKQDKKDTEERKRHEQQLADSAAAVNNPSTVRRDTTRRATTSQ
ncbi:translocation/assembly module TamB domain-containing protein [Hymenobacter cheonanensis]|uniref:translocation/assembly module TamB domain-containing protein n=1 Tax=Hymenobacter sp. CA2-7 TaxID=3063993 RepID=UPI0027125B9D|nr:translocation/assembly module TamB domain-containing protein [Hymenobacter sp. CA2-7]MDO7885795.1 translocation/assembly module TamB domain-containing protein [Hymenobacter sp. CA2-7]